MHIMASAGQCCFRRFVLLFLVAYLDRFSFRLAAAGALGRDSAVVQHVQLKEAPDCGGQSPKSSA
jgi:hypothetical protein